jgi:hypothetical protein
MQKKSAGYSPAPLCGIILLPSAVGGHLALPGVRQLQNRRNNKREKNS